MRRRDFLKMLGWGPVVAGLGAAFYEKDSWRKWLGWSGRDYGMKLSAELDNMGYLTSDTEWFLDEDTAKNWQVRFGSGYQVKTRSWDPGGRDPSPKWIDDNLGKPGFAEEYLRRWGHEYNG